MRFKILISFLLYAGISFPQEIVVLDSSTGKPVYNVNIISTDLLRSASTDSEGKFNISYFSENDSLRFSHISYKIKILSVTEIILNKKIFLVPAFIKHDEIKITEKKYESSGVTFKEELEINKGLKDTYTNIGDILKTGSSLFIKDYGGFSGIKTISSRGMNSENTIILFNEARVNDLQTGIFDLSSISSLSIEKIEFQKTIDDNTSYSSAGGVLKIFTDKDFKGRKINGGLRLTSDNYQSAFIRYSDGNEDIFFNITGERSNSSNHYNYIFSGEELKRENSHFNKSILSGDINFNSSKFDFSIYSIYSYFNSGIPGFVVTNNYNSSRATNRNSKSLSILNSKYSFNENFELTGIASFNKQSLLLYDPDLLLVNSNDNQESTLSDFSAMIKGDWNYNWLHVNAGNEFTSSSLNNFTSFVSSNLVPDHIERISNKIFTNVKLNFLNPSGFISSTSLLGKISYDIVNEDIGREISSNNFSYDLGLSIIPPIDPFINIKTHYGSNTRFPTFNERYYSNLYNHYELGPEKYKIFDAGADVLFYFLGDTKFSAAYFFIDGKDKIIWIPTRLALQTPRNISKINTQGVELSIEKKLFGDIFDISFFYIYTDARNKSKVSENDLSYNKQIIYTPAHRFNFIFTAKFNPFSFSLYSFFVDKRFYTTDNNNNYLLPEYFITDISASYNFKIFNHNQSLTLTVYNLLKEDYFVIQSYPMPLRTFLITLNMEIL